MVDVNQPVKHTEAEKDRLDGLLARRPITARSWEESDKYVLGSYSIPSRILGDSLWKRRRDTIDSLQECFRFPVRAGENGRFHPLGPKSVKAQV